MRPFNHCWKSQHQSQQIIYRCPPWRSGGQQGSHMNIKPKIVLFWLSPPCRRSVWRDRQHLISIPPASTAWLPKYWDKPTSIPIQTAKPGMVRGNRKDVVTRLQTLEILKMKPSSGLDKDAEVQNQFKNVEAEFYANQSLPFISERQTAVDDARVCASSYNHKHALSNYVKSTLLQRKKYAPHKNCCSKVCHPKSWWSAIPTQNKNLMAFSPQQLSLNWLPLLLTWTEYGDKCMNRAVIGNRFYLFKLR